MTPLVSVGYRTWFAVIVAAVGACRLVRAFSTHRGRRLWLSSWRRLTRWEFWPPWVFYPPLFLYLGYLSARHRSLTLFTAANPGILAGGFVGESKSTILEGLGAAAGYVARWRLLDAGASADVNIERARRFMCEEQLTFPVVLKPDQGQRGAGVVIVRSTDALEDCLRRSSVDTIIQEFVSGQEFGIFYYRRPHEPHGRIFSVTRKHLPSIVGDGRRTLEALILDDDRAVCAARLYFERHRERLSDIPGVGEVVPLAELGSHCRGAMFLNGESIVTPALSARFDAIARGFDGFLFGRFDVRLDDGLAAFGEGHGFKIIELNGVTSEATHVYHPGTPLLTGYRVLARQWQIAFEIAEENRRLGHKPTTIRTLVSLMRQYQQTSRGHLAHR
jgi:hypothetical protein